MDRCRSQAAQTRRGDPCTFAAGSSERERPPLGEISDPSTRDPSTRDRSTRDRSRSCPHSCRSRSCPWHSCRAAFMSAAFMSVATGSFAMLAVSLLAGFGARRQRQSHCDDRHARDQLTH